MPAKHSAECGPATLDPMRAHPDGFWHFWIDRGGTFTDIVAQAPDGRILTHKLLSVHPERYDDAVLEGIRHMLGVTPGQALPLDSIRSVKMGTTVATNALLERRGEPVLLIVTRGFAEILRIAYQNRPRLFARAIQLPRQLYEDVLEIKERLAADGSVIEPLDLEAARAGMVQAYARGLRAVAIVLLHAYREPVHERALAQLAREVGFNQVSVSHEVASLIRVVARGDTTVLDAYLTPVLRRYVNQVAQGLTGVSLKFMQSHGALTDAPAFQGKDAVLSGPAGGMVGMARVSQRAGMTRVIGFDMGGTSTDVSHYAGEFERVLDTQIAGVRLRVPMLSIHTVAAGGGSILRFDGARLRVGPDSAGADPGPACYRRGGPLTVTDANLLLGRLHPEWFPHVFGPQANQPLDRECVLQQFTALAQTVHDTTGIVMSPEQLAQGFLDIANAKMAHAIRQVSVQRGYDVRDYTLTVFGGAGGQHACAVSTHLGMRQVLVHPLAGVLSAYGMGLAQEALLRERTLEHFLDASGWHLAQTTLAELEAEARQTLVAQGVEAAQLEARRWFHLKYAGTDTALAIPAAPLLDLVSAFEQVYRKRFAWLMTGRALVIDSVGVEVATRYVNDGVEGARVPVSSPAAPPAPSPVAHRPFFAGGNWVQAPVYQRTDLESAMVIHGPAIVAETTATTVLEPGWQALVSTTGDLILARTEHQALLQPESTELDPIRLEIFNHLFMAVAEQMGDRLQATAYSVNIKERLDFSCAVFDVDGRLIANAPHMPVHLGSMGASVRAVIEDNRGHVVPGDVYMLNDPYRGGTHLPDITVITPVFDPGGQTLLFWVGSRGHHADIGGLTPGSMPPHSTRIAHEGILFTNFKLVQKGVFQEAAVREHLAQGPYPARNPDQNVADLRAQVAANDKGREALWALIERWGLAVVQAYMGHVQDHAAESVRQILGILHDGTFTLDMDHGARINVAIRVDHVARRAVIDFTGTSEQQPSNFNAPRAVTTAAVLYVFRTLIDDDIPLNEGCLEPLEIIVPEGSLLNPVPPAAVVAGNVETSMCVTNALYGALGLMASGPSTMSNLTFGNARHQYYETISGGSGAGGVYNTQGALIDGFHGTAAVQTHMTNSRLTDPEVLEWRFPVRVRSHTLRSSSGGAGRWRGGDGAVRALTFLEPMTVSLLANSRRVAPFGCNGGEAGQPGYDLIERADGRVEPWPATGSVEVGVGDTVVIQTPGGGGFGTAS
jgi:5-oxoprolinase (ATP-hydrolysing)